MLGWLATGGMSELYLARQAGPSGFQRVVVLKVILPHLAEDRELVQMFENEAKVAALLNHPNVVQISDFGSDRGIHYLTMEYIDGQPLSRLHRELATRGQLMPIPVACRLTSDATAGLAYAHDLCDAAGERLQVIHRDVSLENILLSYTGQVKVVDFGLAKARTLISLTRQGTLKGKYRYMAPEMISGEGIDHRIDIFALGVVLYALTTGRMPFEGQTHTELLRRIVRERPVPPRDVNPRIPGELEPIILRALERDPARRYPHASELQRDLEAFMMRTGSVITPYQLAQFMATLFPPGSDPGREEYQRLVGVASAPVADDLCDAPTLLEASSARARERSNATPAAVTQQLEAASALPTAPVALAALPSSPTAATVQLAPDPTAPTAIFAQAGPSSSTASLAPRRSVTPLLFAAGAVLLFLGGGALFLLWDRAGAPPPDAARPAARDAATATRPSPDAARAAPSPDAAATAARALDAARPSPDAAAMVASRAVDAATARDARKVPRPAAPRRGKLTILVWPYGTVSLDGKALGATPLPPQLVSEGLHRLEIENRALGQRRTLEVRVKGGREVVVKVKLDAPP